MSGETDIDILLSGLTPVLQPQTYVFVSVLAVTPELLSRLQPKCMFYESEGVTLILTQDVADEHGFDYANTYRCITCHIYSSLEAVGMTAAVATALTEHNISANVIAAFHHDHIFVASADAHRAVDILAALG
jgi:hypothetical protein